MITVMDLLSQPIFSEFKLTCGKDGLYNVVTGTGIFEWESFAELESTFAEGEFIVTTLSQAKGDKFKANECLINLLNKNVSSISIKSVYFTKISLEVQTISNEKKIPIFFFSNTFFDDIIFTVKTALLSDLPSANFSESIYTLLENKQTNEEVRHIARNINPLFFEHLLCAYISFRGLSSESKIKQKEFYASYCLQKNKMILDSTFTAYCLTLFDDGILIIYTKATTIHKPTDLKWLLGHLGISPNHCHIGLSTCHLGLENLGCALTESFYANTSCILDNEGILSFEETGLDQILMPNRNNTYTLEYYNYLLKKLQDHDEKHQILLMDTILEYTACSNDIQLTAQKTFQHSNTIRYRLDKAKKIFSIEDNAEFHRQLYIFCRLHNIYQHLKRI